MTIVDLIKREHAEVADLFDHLLVLARDDRHAAEAVRVAARLVATVRVHARAEETVFYEALRTRSPELRWFALAAPHEHENVDTTLDKLLVRRPGDEEYQVIIQVARDLFEMHARDEEEAEILPLAAQALTPEELVTLADDMRDEEARIRPGILRLVGMPAHAA